ncbi:MAG: lysozyme inhibitor LprI family protein [Janthinobacterium lividum]
MIFKVFISFAGGLMLMGVAGPAHADRLFDACEAKLVKQSHIDSEMGSCGAAWVGRAEKWLATSWKRALSSVGESQTDQGRALLNEQRAWIGFKDKACLRYELQSSGTLSRFHDANICIAEIIEDRISELSGNLHDKALG